MSGRAARRLIPLRRPATLRGTAREHHPNPLATTTRGWKAALKEAEIPTTRHDAELKRGLELGLPGAKCLGDRTIPTFSRGELPHFAGINTFMKAPYGPRTARTKQRAKCICHFERVPFRALTPYTAIPGARSRGRARGGQVRRNCCWRAFRRRRHLPRRHSLRPARHQADLVSLHAVQLRCACTPTASACSSRSVRCLVQGIHSVFFPFCLAQWRAPTSRD